MGRRESISETDETQRQPPVLRAELAAIVVIVLLGATLRFAYPSRLAVEHFDEGVYASNIWFGEASDYRYPARHLYAPPLLPALIEWSIILFGMGPISVKLVSLLAGTATIVVVWWVGRRWFGREAGIAAATLASLSDIHILYSRMVLTDVLMCLWLLIAVGCVHEMLARGRQGWAVGAGMATGLAWLTKYNGWMPIAVATSGFVFYALVSKWKSRETPVPWRGFSISLVLMTITAAVVWSPAWFDLQDRGGYGAVAANHRGYLVGFEGWLGSLKRQLGNHRYLEGWASSLSMGLACVAALVVAHPRSVSSTWNRRMFVVGMGLLLTAIGLSCGVSVALGATTVLAGHWHFTRSSRSEECTLAMSLLAVWFVGLSLVTPMYFPYTRLTLPWLVAAWLGGGVMIGRIVGSTSPPTSEGGSQSPTRDKNWMLTGLLVVSVLAIVCAAFWSNPSLNRPAGWRPQSGLQTIAESVFEETGRKNVGPQSIFQVYAEPGLFFQLAATARGQDEATLVVPTGSLSLPAKAPEVPTFLLTGPNAHREPNHNRKLKLLGDRLQLLGEYEYRPGPAPLLNWYSSSEIRYSRLGPHKVRLYRVR